MTSSPPRRYTAEDFKSIAAFWQRESNLSREYKAEMVLVPSLRETGAMLLQAAEDVLRLEQIATEERARIVKFLTDVFDSSTHGASGLFERAIDAVEKNDMTDPVRVASPYRQEP